MLKRARMILPLMSVAVLMGCGRAHLFYDTRELRHAPLQKDQYAAVDQVVVDKLAGRSVTWVDDDGRSQVVPAALVPKRLGIAERGALWLTLSGSDLGGEVDVRVRIGKGSTPVTVYIGLDGDIKVVTGTNADLDRDRDDRDGDRDDDAAPSTDDIRARFDLGGKIPGKWSAAERRALAQSLALLAPQELATVKGVHFNREAAPRDRDPSRAALYEMKGCRAIIFVYSSSVRADAFRFVGDARAPKPAVLHSILHEVGHAFEQHAAREKYCAAERSKDVRKANALISEGNDLTSASPVLSEYVRVLGGLPAPTDYGNASLHESFAESFALFHVDPQALERTRPQVHAWFARGGHLSSPDRS